MAGQKKVVSSRFPLELVCDNIQHGQTGLTLWLASLPLAPAEEDAGEHQCQAGAGDEEWQVHSGLQDLPEDPALWQG